MEKWYIYLHGWLIFMVNVGKYTIHGSYGFVVLFFFCGNILYIYDIEVVISGVRDIYIVYIYMN